jgi:hypothetical protein
MASARRVEEVLTLAWDPERDLDRLPAALRPFRARGWRLARGTLWGLCWESEDPEERDRWSDEAVLCRGPHRGLLVHPQLEDLRRITLAEPPPWLPSPARGLNLG